MANIQVKKVKWGLIQNKKIVKVYSKPRYSLTNVSTAVKKGLEPIGITNLGNIGLTATKDAISIYLEDTEGFAILFDKALTRLGADKIEAFFKNNLIYEIIDAYLSKVSAAYGAAFSDLVSDVEIEYVRRVLVKSKGFKEVLKKHGVSKELQAEVFNF